MSAPIVCPQCSVPIPPERFGVTKFTRCTGCNTPLLARAFPALLRLMAQGISAEQITETGQATCFYHPNKTAHVPCDACGRLICALCDVELHGQHLCPGCIESGRRKGSLTTLESRRVLWDNISLWVAILPALLCGWLVVITSPAAIILAVVGWRKPRSLVPRWTRFRFVIAMAFAFLALVGLGALFYFIFSGMESPFSVTTSIQR